MEIITKKLDELKPYEKNPRKNDEAVRFVAQSIKQFGFKIPIIIDKDNVIVAGHTRYKACKELGIEEAPCILADDLTPEQVRAFRIAENKTSERATWDNDILGDELKSLIGDFNMTDFGFGEFELSILMDDFEPEDFDDVNYEEYEETSQKSLARNRVIITFEPNEEPLIKELLGVEGDLKVVYRLSELKQGGK